MANVIKFPFKKRPIGGDSWDLTPEEVSDLFDEAAAELGLVSPGTKILLPGEPAPAKYRRDPKSRSNLILTHRKQSYLAFLRFLNKTRQDQLRPSLEKIASVKFPTTPGC